ncbi:hypothetical protein ACUOCP_37070, partial [Escherichia sp. R-CC3]
FEPVGQFFADLWTGISDTASEIWTGITDYFSESWSSFIELADSILSPLGEFNQETSAPICSLTQSHAS